VPTWTVDEAKALAWVVAVAVHAHRRAPRGFAPGNHTEAVLVPAARAAASLLRASLSEDDRDADVGEDDHGGDRVQVGCRGWLVYCVAAPLTHTRTWGSARGPPGARVCADGV
jgi:hypothetical protein